MPAMGSSFETSGGSSAEILLVEAASECSSLPSARRWLSCCCSSGPSVGVEFGQPDLLLCDRLFAATAEDDVDDDEPPTMPLVALDEAERGLMLLSDAERPSFALI